MGRGDDESVLALRDRFARCRFRCGGHSGESRSASFAAFPVTVRDGTRWAVPVAGRGAPSADLWGVGAHRVVHYTDMTVRNAMRWRRPNEAVNAMRGLTRD